MAVSPLGFTESIKNIVADKVASWNARVEKSICYIVNMPKIIVGMSGGVDSSVTAYLLKERGYEVEGVSFLMWEAMSTELSACCSLKTTAEAAKTAGLLGIRHATVDVRDDFKEKVVKPFADAYLAGLTPNPCVLCNRFIKFPYLLREAERRGAECVATGHYARVDASLSSEGDAFLLRKGVDPKKDQSYVLYTLGQEELRRLILPLGNFRKSDVRDLARSLDLPCADQPGSQEICFVEDRNYLAFIEKISPLNAGPGPIIDACDRIVGTHKGIYGYTIGQRKGLGISSPEPLYVIDTDIRKNTVYVGPRDSAKKREFLVEDLNWIIPPASDDFRALVKIRSTMKEEPANITLVRTLSLVKVSVVFDEPQWAPAPGQSAVFYDGDKVMGGGVIKKSI